MSLHCSCHADPVGHDDQTGKQVAVTHTPGRKTLFSTRSQTDLNV